MTLSKRAKGALEVLRAGGYWRKALETNTYTRREQFETRLRDAHGTPVKGYGWKTWNELWTAGLLKYRACEKSSTWPTEWEEDR